MMCRKPILKVTGNNHDDNENVNDFYATKHDMYLQHPVYTDRPIVDLLHMRYFLHVLPE